MSRSGIAGAGRLGGWVAGVCLVVLAPGAIAARRPFQGAGQAAEWVGLQSAAQRYREIALRGGWPRVDSGPTLRPGDQEARIPLLRARLLAEGYPVEAGQAESEVYDTALVEVVQRFQDLHGLTADGIVGPATLAALDVPAEARARQIESNLQRGNSLPDSLGERYVLVNSAAFTLDVMERGRLVLHLQTIVGRTDWQTPVLSSRIAELAFSPLWRVPVSIARQEVIPLARRDSSYLSRVGMRVYLDSSGVMNEVAPDAVDWAAAGSPGTAYRFVQEPGPANPLGGVKFVFRNSFGVYLHDTPAQALFGRRERALSHGCVRVQHAEQLAAYLLPEWPMDSVRSAMATGQERRVTLTAPIPVYLVYWTAWPEGGGMVAFRNDIYEKDPAEDRVTPTGGGT